MDADGFAVQGRGRKVKNRETVRDRDRASFLREVPNYRGTPEDFERTHAARYGREEGLGPDGKHHHGSHQFPSGSDRKKLYDQYSASTRGRDTARNGYKDGLGAANNELRRMGKEQRQHYHDNTGGLPPHQHERLEPRARDLMERSYR